MSSWDRLPLLKRENFCLKFCELKPIENNKLHLENKQNGILDVTRTKLKVKHGLSKIENQTQMELY